MAQIKVDPGICGLPSVVTATKDDGGRFSVHIQSECSMVQQIQEHLGDLRLRDIFASFLDNPVYLAASKTLRHSSCPVPSGILKTLEVEAEMALPKDVHMTFERHPTRGT